VPGNAFRTSIEWNLAVPNLSINLTKLVARNLLSKVSVAWFELAN